MDTLKDLAAAIAKTEGLPTEIFYALVTVESGWQPWCCNPEPRYRYFWDVHANKPFRAVSAAECAAKFPPKDFHCLAGDPDAEWWNQQQSFGLTQLMGAVARELGFKGPWLGELYDPTTNLALGARHLADFHDRFHAKYGWAGVLRAYNGGPAAAQSNSNPEYVAKYVKLLGKLPD